MRLSILGHAAHRRSRRGPGGGFGGDFPPRRWVAIGLLFTALAVPAAEAAQFRGFNTIRTPAALPPGTVPVERVVPIDQSLIEQAVRDLMAAWNSGGLERMLANDFFDRSRLLDAIVPREQCASR